MPSNPHSPAEGRPGRPCHAVVFAKQPWQSEWRIACDHHNFTGAFATYEEAGAACAAHDAENDADDPCWAHANKVPTDGMHHARCIFHDWTSPSTASYSEALAAAEAHNEARTRELHPHAHAS